MSNSVEQTISIPKTMRYLVSGNPETSDHLVIVLHGYGQLVRYFIQHFNELPTNTCVIAPEGMHRFYLNGTSGRVGASWMTKEARETDILDIQIYLDTLLSEFLQQHSFNKITLLGFSQGGATAARFFDKTAHKIDHLIIWASDFPSDIAPSLTSEKYASNQHYFVLGDQDEYFTPDARIQTFKKFTDLGFKTLAFQGTHTIDKQTLKDILKEIE